MATKKKAVKKSAKKAAAKSTKKSTSKPASSKGGKKVPAKKKTQAAKKTAVKNKSKPMVGAPTPESVPKAGTATISAIFTYTNPGLSELNATLNDVTKQLTQTGTLVFENTVPGDIIIIQGKSLGTSDISIDVPASPQKMKFPPGTFNFNFFIL